MSKIGTPDSQPQRAITPFSKRVQRGVSAGVSATSRAYCGEWDLGMCNSSSFGMTNFVHESEEVAAHFVSLLTYGYQLQAVGQSEGATDRSLSVARRQ